MALVPLPDPTDTEESQLPDEPAEFEAGKMSFLEHLDELRKRLVVSAVALLVGFLICFAFISPIFDFMRPGDVATHILNGHAHNILDGNGRIRPEVREARDGNSRRSTARVRSSRRRTRRAS